jgi:DNA-binding MurR/RpiR family transcriptional regulator
MIRDEENFLRTEPGERVIDTDRHQKMAEQSAGDGRPAPAKALPHPLQTVRSIYAELPASERRIADVLLHDPEAVVFASITDLSQQAGVAESSVIRFARRVGQRGYQSLKLALAQELAGSHKEEPPDEGEDSRTLRTVMSRHRRALEETMALLEPAICETVAARMADARRIHIFGAGPTGVAALDAQFRFSRIGLPIVATTDAYLTMIDASLLEAPDVAIAISVSGQTREIVASLQAARAAGAYCVAVTSHSRSPLARGAHAILPIAATEGPIPGTAFTAKVGIMYVLDVLLSAVIARDTARALDFAERTTVAVKAK